MVENRLEDLSEVKLLWGSGQMTDEKGKVNGDFHFEYGFPVEPLLRLSPSFFFR